MHSPLLDGTAPVPRSDAPGAVLMDGVRKVYGTGESSVTAIFGPSGSGKSTFLQLAAGLDTPTAGRVALGGADLGGLSQAALTELRRERADFVFRAFNLLPSLTVEQNVALPVRLAARGPARGRPSRPPGGGDRDGTNSSEWFVPRRTTEPSDGSVAAG